jgi:hypothetical protein
MYSKISSAFFASFTGSESVNFNNEMYDHQVLLHSLKLQSNIKKKKEVLMPK